MLSFCAEEVSKWNAEEAAELSSPWVLIAKCKMKKKSTWGLNYSSEGKQIGKTRKFSACPYCQVSAEAQQKIEQVWPAVCVCVCTIKKSVSLWNQCLSSHQQENNQLKLTRKEIGMQTEDCWASGTLYKYNFPSQQEEWHKRQFKSMRVAASMTREICY